MRTTIALALLLGTWIAGPQLAPNPASVSIIRLIATPGQFDGKRVTVVGFLMARHERTILFVNAEDAQHYIPANGLWVHADSRMSEKMESLDDHYVLVVGTFIATKANSVGLASGEIKDIKSLSLWGSPE